MKEFNRYPRGQQIINRCSMKNDNCHIKSAKRYSEMEQSIAENELIIESAEEVISDANIDENLKEVLLWMLEKMK